MLAPTDTRLLSDALRPPRGFELDQLVVTTYSLDLVSLLSIPLAFTSFALEDGDGHPLSDPLLLIEGLRRNADRITVFCQAGEVALPLRRQSLFVYLEDSVVPVRAPSGGVFHPKVWVCSYAAPDRAQVVRVLCLSRNLTNDRSRDTVLCLEGEAAVADPSASARALSDFVTWLAEQAAGAASARVAKTKALAALVRKSSFTPPAGFSGMEFRPLGIPKYRADPLDVRRDRVLVVSPFLSSHRLNQIVGRSRNSILISRPEALAAVDEEARARFTSAYTVNEAAEPESVGDEEETDSPRSDAMRGLHAKLFVVDQGRDASLFAGSANATNAAFTRNVEFLVELRGSKRFCGVDAVLGDAEGATLRAMLVPFEIDDEVVPVDDAVDRELDRVAHLVAGIPLQAHVEVVGDTHTVSLRGEAGDVLPELEGVELRCWPITLAKQGFATSLDLSTDPAAVFDGVPLTSLTEFFVVEASVQIVGTRAEARFVAQWKLVGAPEGREHAVLLSLLDDPQRVLAFIRLMLAEAGAEADGAGAPLPLSMTSGDGSDPLAWVTDSEPLLEALVRALEADPRRLDSVARVVDDLSTTHGGVERLPSGFLEIWRPIWSAREHMRANQ